MCYLMGCIRAGFEPYGVGSVSRAGFRTVSANVRLHLLWWAKLFRRKTFFQNNRVWSEPTRRTAQIRRRDTLSTWLYPERAEIFALPAVSPNAKRRTHVPLDRSPNAGYILVARERFTLPRSG